MNSVWNFKKKFVSIFMSVLLAFMMFPFVAFADTGQEPADKTDAAQDQASHEECNLTDEQMAPDNGAVDEQSASENAASSETDVTGKETEAAEQDEVDSESQEAKAGTELQSSSQAIPTNDTVNKSKGKVAFAEKATLPFDLFTVSLVGIA